MVPFVALRKRLTSCWCGAHAGEGCRNRDGSPSPLHQTRGELSRKQINIFLRAAGQEPLPPEEDER